MFSSSMASYDDLNKATANAISKVFLKKTGGSPHCEISLNSSLISMFCGRNKSPSFPISSSNAYEDERNTEKGEENNEEEERKARAISASLLFLHCLVLYRV